ncbi:MAG: hypothetical protein WD738_00095 [Pirellulales bacterium]
MSSVERLEIKQIVKEAIKEVMTENSEVLKDLVIEVIEDAALLQRMAEGRQTELVSREAIMDVLEPKH